MMLRLETYKVTLNQDYWLLISIVVPLSILVFVRLGLYRAVIRYVSARMITTTFIGSFLSLILLWFVALIVDVNIPRSVSLIYFLMVLVLITGSRLAIRGWIASLNRHKSGAVLIYGAGQAGRQLIEALRQVDEYYPVAFIDDNPELQKTTISGRHVYPSSQIGDLLSRFDVKKILLAMPSTSIERKKQILMDLDNYSIEVMTIPGMKELVDGKISVSALKKVSVIDLLGRAPVEPNLTLLASNITDKVVMVTGAGGSIGSELCRQIIQQAPKTIVLFELSEYFLYSIDKELREYCHNNNLSTEIVPLLGSVQHQRRMYNIMLGFGVQTIYHAAAYKHVPMVEFNTIEGIRNNVYGTLFCAQAAVDAKVETFVLISTDKAVRPTNTMGATKRMAELVLQALAAEYNMQTRFCMVRFGNVLGSSGSVVPVFEKQIAEGGPITLTHPAITRYFMTIPEAAQLVI